MTLGMNSFCFGSGFKQFCYIFYYFLEFLSMIVSAVNIVNKYSANGNLHQVSTRRESWSIRFGKHFKVSGSETISKVLACLDTASPHTRRGAYP